MASLDEQLLDQTSGSIEPFSTAVRRVLVATTYIFDFSLLSRWLELCRKHGMRGIEVAHLFTQWGAEATPAIYVDTDAGQERRFGWDVPATDRRYRTLMAQLLPELRSFLDEHWGLDKVIFHVSDEPLAANLDTHSAAQAVVADLLEGCIVVDAIDDFDLYEQGVVSIPVVRRAALHLGQAIASHT